jgi:hypothetical protein
MSRERRRFAVASRARSARELDPLVMHGSVDDTKEAALCGFPGRFEPRKRDQSQLAALTRTPHHRIVETRLKIVTGVLKPSFALHATCLEVRAHRCTTTFFG